MKKLIPLLCLSILALFVAAPIHAELVTSATSSAQLDWSNLTITGSIEWSPLRTRTSVAVNLQHNGVTDYWSNPFGTLTGWVDSTRSASGDLGNGIVIASSSILSVASQVGPIESQNSEYWAQLALADGDASRAGSFTFTGSEPSLVTISIPFTSSWNFSLAPNTDFWVQASSRAFIDIGLGDYNHNYLESVSDGAGGWGAHSDSGSDNSGLYGNSKSGTLCWREFLILGIQDGFN